MAELPISRPHPGTEDNVGAPITMFDDEDGIEFDETAFFESNSDTDSAQGPLTEAQVARLLSSTTTTVAPNLQASGTATPILPANKSGWAIRNTSSSSAITMGSTEVSPISAASQSQSGVRIGEKRRRYRKKGSLKATIS